ncbi:MAG: molybdopterin molybdotransferase MoeA, partial [Nitrososphaerota archaeon]
SYTPVVEAQEILLTHVHPINRTESISVLDAIGRVAATTIKSPKDIPPWDSSHMDGFAVRHTDLAGASEEKPVRLGIVGTVRPGTEPQLRLGPGEAARILTGAYLPEGADTVVPQEEVVVEDGWAIFTRRPEAGEFIDRKGFDLSRGEEIVNRGQVLRPADATLLAHVGVWYVDVVKRPVVAIMAVGDELTDDPRQVEKGKIFNTHSHLLKHLVMASGCVPLYIGIQPDELGAVGQAVRKALNEADLLLTIAGSSVSEKDVSSQVFTELGAEYFVHGLRLQPGRVGGFALVGGRPAVLLPGLIMSTLNVFMFLAYPLIRHLQGLEPRIYHRRVMASLAETVRFRKYHDFKKVVWVKLRDDGESVTCHPRLGESSGMSIPARTDGFIVAEPGVAQLWEGEKVWVNLPP